ncbi:MAG: peptidase MA family metallohydrolase [Anaerolineales bacterium]
MIQLEKMRFRDLLILLGVALILGAVQTAQADNGIEVLSHDVEYLFGKKMTFQARIESEREIQAVELIVEVPGTPTFVGITSYSPTGEIEFIYDLAQRPLRVFSTVSYYFRFKLKNGEEARSEKFSFPYLDNRYQWQVLDDGKFVVHWYDEEVTFAQKIADAAEAGREKVLELLERPKNNQQINIYVYSSTSELQSTLAAAGVSWVGGHADPKYGSVVVAIPPGVDRNLEIQRQIPHEITHVMLYRFMDAGYQYLPYWVNEGIASQVELFPNPAYDEVLEKAHEENQLIPISQLCHSFPADQDAVVLAYAESSSLISYIKREFGITGVQALISAYDRGVSCDRGVEIALGQNLRSLEKAWKREMFGGAYRELLQAWLLPVLLVLGVIVILVVGVILLRMYLGRRDRKVGGYNGKR